MEWTDIINEVLNEQAQPEPVAMWKQPGNDNLRNQIGVGSAGGGGWSYGGKYKGQAATPAAGELRRTMDKLRKQGAYEPAPMPPPLNAPPMPHADQIPLARIRRGNYELKSRGVPAPPGMPRMNSNRNPQGSSYDEAAMEQMMQRLAQPYKQPTLSVVPPEVP